MSAKEFYEKYYKARTILYTHEEAKDLVQQGYRRTSNKHALAARIDRPDWRQVMAQDHAPWDWQGDGLTWVNCLTRGGAQDYYRRCLSKDVVKMLDEVSHLMPTSNNDSCGYIHKKGDKTDG